MDPNELRQEAARIVAELRELNERVERDNGGVMDATDQARYDAAEERYTSLMQRAERLERQQAREDALAEVLPLPELGDGQRFGASGGRTGEPEAYRESDLPADAPDRTVRMAFLDIVRGREIPAEVRALVEDTNGAVLVPDDTSNELVRTIAGLVVMRSLASVRQTSLYRVPRKGISEVSVGWGSLERGTTVTDSMPSKPTKDWIYAEDLNGLAKIGVDELADTDVNLEAYLRDSFSRALAEAEDTAFTVGTGHSDEQPAGWAKSTEITALTGSSATYAGTEDKAYAIIDDLLKLTYKVPERVRSRSAFVMNSATALFVQTRRDSSSGQSFWQPSTQAGTPPRLHGYPVRMQDDVAQIAASKVIAGFGDWAQGYRIIDRLGMTVQRMNEKYAEAGQVGFLIRRRVGGGVWNSDALRTLKTKSA